MSSKDVTYYVLLSYDIDTNEYDIRCRSDIYTNKYYTVDNNYVYADNKVFTIIYSDLKRTAFSFCNTIKLLYCGIKVRSTNYKQFRATNSIPGLIME